MLVSFDQELSGLFVLTPKSPKGDLKLAENQYFAIQFQYMKLVMEIWITYYILIT
jgi:hypothetical protein